MNPGDRVLDACCGTGDLAIAASRRGAATVVGLDFSQRMLDRAMRKSQRVEWVGGDLLDLPFGAETFDAATVGFGVRNVVDLERALRELRRVLRPGGRLAILEITQAAWPAETVLLALVRPRRAASRQAVAGWQGVHVSAGERPAGSRGRGLGGRDGGVRLRRGRVPAPRAARSSRSTPGLQDDPPPSARSRWSTPRRALRDISREIEERLAPARSRVIPVLAAAVRQPTRWQAGGKRLRPALAYLSRPGESAGRRLRPGSRSSWSTRRRSSRRP